MYERLIVIGGCAHSGTTPLAYVLAQHPQCFLSVQGSEKWLLETDTLPAHNLDLIEALLAANPTKYLILKRPWIEADEALPRLTKHVFCMVKDKGAQFKSWSKPRSLIWPKMRNNAAVMADTYATYVEAANKFNVIQYAEFLANPQQVLDGIIAKVGLSPFTFDTSFIGEGRDVKQRILKSRSNLRLPRYTARPVLGKPGSQTS